MGVVSPLSGNGSIQSAIAYASRRTGVDFSYLLGQAQLESGLNAGARAATSSATGLYQFVDQSWLAVVKNHGAEHGLAWAADSIKQTGRHFSVSDGATRSAILAMRNDPEIASLMAASHASDNAQALQATLGRPASGTDLYMAHFLGLGGARTFLSALERNPQQSAAALFPAAAHANHGIFYGAGGQPRSLAEIYNRFANKLETASTGASAAAAAAPALLAGDGSEVVPGNGDNDGSAMSWAESTLAQLNTASARQADLLRPTPDTARLAYMMLASMGG